ncbi:hypothetical protein BCV70DRAFT_102348 [Testicularia cyperi]|uniref:Uncharacterized protein n=1 Tax=Testicularia cyperi TaxID=1882483 RepID=A0A317XEH2_9BASI|nr:hypothetical protein BCV70DRAFT_102348 [Testicularia cyperi]
MPMRPHLRANICRTLNLHPRPSPMVFPSFRTLHSKTSLYPHLHLHLHLHIVLLLSLVCRVLWLFCNIIPNLVLSSFTLHFAACTLQLGEEEWGSIEW